MVLFILKDIPDVLKDVPVVTLAAKDNQNIQNLLTKDLKDQCVGMNIKQKVRIKIRQMNIDIFLDQTL